MKCTHCGFVSFDFLDNCKRCGKVLAGKKYAETKTGERKTLFPFIKSQLAEKQLIKDEKEEEIQPVEAKQVEEKEKKEYLIGDEAFNEQFDNLFSKEDDAEQGEDNDVIKLTAVDNHSERRKRNVEEMSDLGFDDSFFKVTDTPENEIEEFDDIFEEESIADSEDSDLESDDILNIEIIDEGYDPEKKK